MKLYFPTKTNTNPKVRRTSEVQDQPNQQDQGLTSNDPKSSINPNKGTLAQNLKQSDPKRKQLSKSREKLHKTTPPSIRPLNVIIIERSIGNQARQDTMNKHPVNSVKPEPTIQDTDHRPCPPKDQGRRNSLNPKSHPSRTLHITASPMRSTMLAETVNQDRNSKQSSTSQQLPNLNERHVNAQNYLCRIHPSSPHNTRTSHVKTSTLEKLLVTNLLLLSKGSL
ncbi:hypothetical protein Dimus_038797 [Dionaea muscipula]